MPKAYSGDLRVRVIEMVQTGASRREAAEEFSVADSTARLLAALGGEWQRRGETARRQCLAAGGACDVDPGGGAGAA